MEGGKGKGLFRPLFSGREQDSLAAAQVPFIRDEKVQEAFLSSCPGLVNGHDEFAGMVLDLKSRAGSGCLACSIVCNGLAAIDGRCTDSSNCTVSWKPRGKATLAVLVHHRYNSTHNSNSTRVIEFSHNLGPFGKSLLPMLLSMY
jgi:hypothetical protein